MNKFVLAIVFALSVSAWADPTTLKQLFDDRKTLDGKEVTVSGTVKSYFEKDSYSSFLLMDGGKGCSVWVSGKKGLKNDQKITVTGTFSLSKKLSNRNFSNVIEASDVQSAP